MTPETPARRVALPLPTELQPLLLHIVKADASPPVPDAEWPKWAKLVKLLAREPDTGVGDTVARTIGPHTSETFKAWHLALFGKPCGCERRQAEWNAKFPYPKATPPSVGQPEKGRT